MKCCMKETSKTAKYNVQYGLVHKQGERQLLRTLLEQLWVKQQHCINFLIIYSNFDKHTEIL